jgi:hypothetical protein
MMASISLRMSCGVTAFVHSDIEAHIVEDEEFGFGAEVGAVADA